MRDRVHGFPSNATLFQLLFTILFELSSSGNIYVHRKLTWLSTIETIEIQLRYMETPEPDLIHAIGYKHPSLRLSEMLTPAFRPIRLAFVTNRYDYKLHAPLVCLVTKDWHYFDVREGCSSVMDRAAAWGRFLCTVQLTWLGWSTREGWSVIRKGHVRKVYKKTENQTLNLNGTVILRDLKEYRRTSLQEFPGRTSRLNGRRTNEKIWGDTQWRTLARNNGVEYRWLVTWWWPKKAETCSDNKVMIHLTRVVYRRITKYQHF
jgi:hypothetical protein